MDCKREFPSYVMDFDHRDASTKRDTVSNLVAKARSLMAIEAEIAKCDLVCSNCHRIRTHRRGQNDSGKSSATPSNQIGLCLATTG